MLKRVKQHEQKGVLKKIETVHEIYEHKSVIEIQKKLLDMYNDRKNQKCLKQEYIDKIFEGPSGRWDDPTDTDKGRTVVKKEFKEIKEQMFEDDSDCIETDSADKW